MKKCNICKKEKYTKDFRIGYNKCKECIKDTRQPTPWGYSRVERIHLAKEGKKRCTTCKVIKDLNAFGKFGQNKDGKESRCLYCKALKLRELKKDLDWKKGYYKLQDNWRRNNLGKDCAKTMLRKSRKLKRTPNWLTKEHLKEIENFYNNCPKGYEVDHIIPLVAYCKISKKRVASGLHVIWNLQYLEKSLNRVKNKYT